MSFSQAFMQFKPGTHGEFGRNERPRGGDYMRGWHLPIIWDMPLMLSFCIYTSKVLLAVDFTTSSPHTHGISKDA